MRISDWSSDVCSSDLPTPAPGTPASSPVADLMARVNALESQLATLTGQTEQNAFKLRQLEEAFNKYKGDMEARATSSAAPPPVTSTVGPGKTRSEEHTSELQSLMRNSSAVFCLK